MPWDPTVLRKYSSTSHFRLLNQVRSELNSHPLARHPDGEINLGVIRRGSPSQVPVEVRGFSSAAKPVRTVVASDQPDGDGTQGDTTSFRERLRAVQMR